MKRLKKLLKWFDDRTGATELVHKGLYEAVPRRGGWAYTLGSATLVLILLQLFTGIFLLFDYAPSTTDAYSSLHYLQTSDIFGAWVRGLHLWGAYTLIFVIGLHMLRTFISASYKAPRELNWVSGSFLMLLVLGLAATGAMLPWDQAAYWTTTVITNIPHYIPGIGDGIRTLWRGGDFVGPITLTRTFAIHVWVLPFLLFSFIGAHLYLLRRHGEFGAWINYRGKGQRIQDVTPDQVVTRIKAAAPPYPTRGTPKEYSAPEHTVDFYPDQLAKDVTVSVILIAIIFAMGLLAGAPLDERADPATLTYVPTPEWFYLPLDQWLVVAPNQLIAAGVIGVVGAVTTAFILLPFIDRNRERRPLRRPEVLIPAAFIVFVVLFFAMLGVNRLYNL